MGNISIVIGSWGSYNECNERALGSNWLDLSDYSDWKEIVEELKREGFELDGIDEELFIQDIEGIYDRSVNWDYMNPENLFNTVYESGVLTNDYKYKELCAFLEVKNYDDFEELVKTAVRIGTITSTFGAVIRGKIMDVKCLTAAAIRYPTIF